MKRCVIIFLIFMVVSVLFAGKVNNQIEKESPNGESGSTEFVSNNSRDSRSVPNLIDYQGRITDSNDIPITSSVSITFAIYNDATSGSNLWDETHSSVTPANGLVHVQLGSVDAFGTSLFNDSDLWLGINVNGDGEMTPRLRIVSVPYAIYAQTAETDNDWTVDGNNMYSTVSGNVGVGTTTPSAKLDVAGRIGTSNTGGSIFIGHDAGLNDDLTSNYNVFIGNSAGYSNTSGWYNSAVGADALLSNNTGYDNSAFGFSALENNTLNANTAIGAHTLSSNLSGYGNTAIGSKALSANLGDGNTAVGYKAGELANNTSGCVFIGKSAGYYADSDNKLYIENSYSASPLIYGDFSEDIVGINGKLGIGTHTPTAPLEVSGRISQINTGNSVFIGEGAGIIDNLSDNNNSFIGYNSGNFNTTGEYNTALGSSTLEFNYGGSNNTAVGFEALSSNNYGDNNTAIGYQSGHVVTNAATGCIYIGYQAGWGNYHDDELFIENSSSTNPLIWGDFSDDILTVNGKLGIGTKNPDVQFHVTGGTDVTLAAGGSILAGLTTGENIVMDENEIMARNNGATSSLHVQRDGGALRLHTDMNEIHQFIVDVDGKTGIGESAPTAKLHINTTSDGLRIQINGGTKLKVSSNGGISNFNATTPTFALQLENSSTDLVGRGRAYSWNVYSDARLKSNQRKIEYGLKEVMQLQPKSYYHHSSSTSEDGNFVMVTDEKISTFGFIAQEVQEIIPEAVSVPEDDSKDLWSMDYDKLIPVLTKAIQEQQNIIEKLSSENKDFRARIEKLEISK